MYVPRRGNGNGNGSSNGCWRQRLRRSCCSHAHREKLKRNASLAKPKWNLCPMRANTRHSAITMRGYFPPPTLSPHTHSIYPSLSLSVRAASFAAARKLDIWFTACTVRRKLFALSRSYRAPWCEAHLTWAEILHYLILVYYLFFFLNFTDFVGKACWNEIYGICARVVLNNDLCIMCLLRTW